MIKSEERFILMASDSTHYILSIESLLKDRNISCRVIPLPSQLKASCGLSVRVEEKYLDNIKELIIEKDLKLELFLMKKIGLSKTFEKIVL